MMLENILFIILGTTLLLFGVFLSAAFAGIRFNKKNLILLCGLCAVCGLLQMSTLIYHSSEMVWKTYPLTTHIPLILFLCVVYRKKMSTALVSVSTVYLCCQASKWFGTLTFSITVSPVAEYIVRIVILLVISIFAFPILAPFLSEIFNKDKRTVCIFGIMPIVYYLFDYATMVYTNLWENNNRVVAEFLPFFLGITYMIFCIIYYKEYEEKADAERKAQILRITTEHQGKYLEEVKRSEAQIRLLRHDMRLFLNSLAVCINSNETEKATEMIASYSSMIEETKVHHFSNNDTVNYVLSAYAAKFEVQHIAFHYTVELAELHIDEVIFASILSNALDNALNAQEWISEDQRSVKLMLKSVEGKLLLSVKNPIRNKPVFVDGLPVSNKKGHGYGTQSIRYMTERLGGNCQFSATDNVFTIRVII